MHLHIMFMCVHMYTDTVMKICLLRGLLDIVAIAILFFFFLVIDFTASISSVKGKTVF